ncbi:hypothetical protein VII00023_03288 [Vibrio ichthyoenteri ATCC 700023]|uniref:Uncharacterized protein n=1 Tax=Vibrio ichthyoenteri ATCC 700023 TaxID=870968 RepID=F9RYM2_9VIBR|nr:hypothetical protein [Vibrio ichthyoenteri]EGU46439.1 hypothetical protein VII00023_03288 [Vibrio ichthyoenteri ATCC 700023]
MKIAAEYLKRYDEVVAERFKRFGEYYPFRTWDELQKHNHDVFDKYIKDIQCDKRKTTRYLDTLSDSLDPFSFYLAFQQRDCQLLNNALYQSSRRQLLSSAITGSGTDHSIFYHALVTAFACNDFAVFSSFFPKQLPFTKYPFYNSPAMNLIKVIYYREVEQESPVLDKAQKFLNKKSPVLDKAVIQYLIALLQRDADMASQALELACVGWQKSRLIDRLGKCFADQVHGLYYFARFIVPDFFARLTRPNHRCFCAEFDDWQIANHYPKGELFYHYPAPMAGINNIFAAQIPDVSLIEYKKNNYYKDEQTFLQNLVIAAAS